MNGRLALIMNRQHVHGAKMRLAVASKAHDAGSGTAIEATFSLEVVVPDEAMEECRVVPRDDDAPERCVRLPAVPGPVRAASGIVAVRFVDQRAGAIVEVDDGIVEAAVILEVPAELGDWAARTSIRRCRADRPSRGPSEGTPGTPSRDDDRSTFRAPSGGQVADRGEATEDVERLRRALRPRCCRSSRNSSRRTGRSARCRPAEGVRRDRGHDSAITGANGESSTSHPRFLVSQVSAVVSDRDGPGTPTPVGAVPTRHTIQSL